MSTLRLKRNILKSLKTYFVAKLSADGWSGITVDLQTKKAISVPSPKILISILDTVNQKREIGSGKFLRFPDVVIRIYGTDGGNREDLADWVNEKLENDIPYYTYTLASGGVFTSILTGNINVIKITRDDHEFANTSPDILDEEDRYRHNITFSCYVGEI